MCIIIQIEHKLELNIRKDNPMVLKTYKVVFDTKNSLLMVCIFIGLCKWGETTNKVVEGCPSNKIVWAHRKKSWIQSA